MAAQQPDLPAYEEIIASLASKLQGLSTVHSGLGEAAELLLLAHSEMEETKRRIEVLSGSTQSMVEEVKQLRPVELAATLDAGMASLTRETTESIDALRERVALVAGEVADSRTASNHSLATIGRQIATQDEQRTEQIQGLGQDLSNELARLRTSVLEPMLAAQQPTQQSLSDIHGVVVESRSRQESLAKVASRISSDQVQLAQRYEALFPLLAELGRRHDHLSEQASAIAQSVARVQQAVNTNQATLSAVQTEAEEASSSLESSLQHVHEQIVGELKWSKRMQWVSLALVLAAIILAWASLSGLIPER
jgi:uncharacterized phage infection (PIP) family protein YhgE